MIYIIILMIPLAYILNKIYQKGGQLINALINYLNRH